uniref:Uncharacterized protein n=1 Tax=Trichuris muris TaxID=70415 RepID=A0A5S6Q988_TRIMR
MALPYQPVDQINNFAMRPFSVAESVVANGQFIAKEENLAGTCGEKPLPRFPCIGMPYKCTQLNSSVHSSTGNVKRMLSR